MIRGIRGAISVERDAEEDVLVATRDLLTRMLDENGLRPESVAAGFLTATPDLTSAFPAKAARQLGWSALPFMCAAEIAVPGALPRIVRAMLLVETEANAKSIRHPYLGRAAALRPDRA